MDIKAICNVVFEDKRTEHSATITGEMNIKMHLEQWETAKGGMRRFIVTRYTEVTRDNQYVLDGMDASGNRQVPVDEHEELYLCPIDTTPSDAIRIALGMWEDPNPVRDLFNRLLTEGKLALKHQYVAQESCQVQEA